MLLHCHSWFIVADTACAGYEHSSTHSEGRHSSALSDKILSIFSCIADQATSHTQDCPVSFVAIKACFYPTFLDLITRFSPVTPPPGTPADCVRAI